MTLLAIILLTMICPYEVLILYILLVSIEILVTKSQNKTAIIAFIYVAVCWLMKILKYLNIF